MMHLGSRISPKAVHQKLASEDIVMNFSVIIKIYLLLVVFGVSLSMLLKVANSRQSDIQEASESKGFSTICEPKPFPGNELVQVAKKLKTFVDMSLPFKPCDKILESPVKVTKEDNLLFFRQKPIIPLSSNIPIAPASYLNQTQNKDANQDSRVLMRSEANSYLDQTTDHTLLTSSATTAATPFNALIDLLDVSFKFTFSLSRIAAPFVRVAIFTLTQEVSGESTTEEGSEDETDETTTADAKEKDETDETTTAAAMDKDESESSNGDTKKEENGSSTVEAMEEKADDGTKVNYHYHYHYNKAETTTPK